MADNNSFLGKLKGAKKESDSRLKADALQRAEEGKRRDSIILNAKDVLSGKWDASKLLFTTLDGKVRPITADDLVAFRYNIKATQSRFTKGITAKQVVDWSNHEDRKKASEEITMVVPHSARNGVISYITNASKKSDVSRHHVNVEFLNFSAESSSGALDPKKSAMRLRKGQLKFDCDCGRHRYWFRYIATIGGYNAGRAETGFPKIRNPKLHGIACKHVIRVMADILGGTHSLAFLTKLLEKAKSSDDAKAAQKTRQIEAEKMVKEQLRKNRNNTITTSDQQRQARSEAKQKKDLTNLLTKAVKPKKVKQASSLKQDKAAATLAQKFNLTPEQVMILLAQASKT